MVVNDSFKTFLHRMFYNHVLRLAVLTGLASALAYVVADLIPLANPIVAALTGLIAVSSTFHNSVKLAFAETAGVMIGALVGFAVTSIVGFNVFVLGVLIATAFIISWLFNLGEKAAVSIGVTMILICGPLLDDIVAVESRVIGVLIGAVFALIASYFVIPGKPHHRALREIRKETREASDLLQNVAETLSSEPLTVDMANRWVTASQSILDSSKSLIVEAEDAMVNVKWNPMLGKKETKIVHRKAQKMFTIVESVNNICSDLHAYVSSGHTMDEVLQTKISELLHTTSEHVISELEDINSSTKKMILTSSLHKRERETIKTAKHIDETQAIILSGSVAGDATRIRESLQ